jgi:hypothetical protein
MLRRWCWLAAAAVLSLLLGVSRVAANTEGEPLHQFFCLSLLLLCSFRPPFRLATGELLVCPSASLLGGKG